MALFSHLPLSTQTTVIFGSINVNLSFLHDVLQWLLLPIE